MTTQDTMEVVEIVAKVLAYAESVSYHKYRDLFDEQAKDILTAIEASGWKIVPVEPTEAMVRAAELCMDDYGTYDSFSELVKAYRAMLSASLKVTR